MTVHELNSKIHLPSYARYLGLSPEYNYQKVPGYGWFGYNRDMSYVFDAIDVTRLNDTFDSYLYRSIALDHPELQEYKIRYSEVVEAKFASNLKYHKQNQEMWMASREAARTDYIRYNARNMKFSDLLDELGEKALAFTGIGIITTRILKQFGKHYKLTDNHCNNEDPDGSSTL